MSKVLIHQVLQLPVVGGRDDLYFQKVGTGAAARINFFMSDNDGVLIPVKPENLPPVDLSGYDTLQALTDGLSGKQPSGTYVTANTPISISGNGGSTLAIGNGGTAAMIGDINNANVNTAISTNTAATLATLGIDLSLYLTKANNLSGLSNVATARTNLGLGASALSNQAVGTGDSPTFAAVSISGSGWVNFQRMQGGSNKIVIWDTAGSRFIRMDVTTPLQWSPDGSSGLANVGISYLSNGLLAIGNGTVGNASANARATAFVTDSSAAHTAGVGAVVAAGGSNIVPVYSTGSAWRIG